jgi:hypothetical protein
MHPPAYGSERSLSCRMAILQRRVASRRSEAFDQPLMETMMKLTEHTPPGQQIAESSAGKGG